MKSMLTKEICERLPNCRILSTVKQEDDESAWLAVRSKGIGGSDVGAICGVSPFSSAKQIYFKKTGQFEDAIKPGEDSRDRMRFGHLLEPIVADEYSTRTGIKLVDINCTVYHKDHPWALANIDRLMIEEIDNGNGTTTLIPIGVLECKTTSEYMNSEWDSGEILKSYIYQLNWYLWILGLERGAFACLVGGNKFYEYDVIRNDELLEEVIIPAAKEFWFENVLKLKEPEMQAVDEELVKALYSDCVKGSEIVLEEDICNELLATIVDCKARIKELESIQKEAENRIKDRLGTNEIGKTTDYVVKWSPRSQTKVDTDLLKTTFPDIYDKVKKLITFKVMSIKGGT